MLKLGIVGLPNVGKSTLFNALTAAGADAANYPFCTVEPNVGMVEVPDPRVDLLAEKVQPQRVLRATVQFVDIAGLVKGASEGEGLGNQFLANIRETDAIVHVVRCFDDPDVVHVMGEVDPVRDREVINLELALADLALVEKRLEKARKAARGNDKEALAELGLLERLVETSWARASRAHRAGERRRAAHPALVQPADGQAGAVPGQRGRGRPAGGRQRARPRAACGRGGERRARRDHPHQQQDRERAGGAAGRGEAASSWSRWGSRSRGCTR